MINSIGTENIAKAQSITFGRKRLKAQRPVPGEKDYLMVEEYNKHPLKTKSNIAVDKLTNALTAYPAKGFKGSVNSNFYEFLTMGIVPYLVGSATLMGVFNLASVFFDAKSHAAARKLGHKMSLGVIFYGLAKTLSKSLIEKPVKMKYGVDVNLPYRKVINEVPEANNQNDLLCYEYHKVFESVDFPRYDLLYNNKKFGDKPNSYYDMVAKKMGFGENLNDSDQKVKQKMRELVVKTRTFTTLSSYLWAATGVGIAMQTPWETSSVKGLKGFVNAPLKAVKSFGAKFGQSCKEFVGAGKKLDPRKISDAAEQLKTKHIAGRVLLGLAIATTVIGNIITLADSNKKKADKAAATPLIDNNKTKVVC